MPAHAQGRGVVAVDGRCVRGRDAGERAALAGSQLVERGGHLGEQAA